LNFGLVYGMSAQGLQRYLAQAGIYLSLPECVKLRNAFFANRQGLVQWLADQIALAKRQGYNETVLHRRRYYPALTSGDRNLIHDAEKALVNHPVQGTAAEIVKKAMIVVDGYTMPIIIQVHDELILEVPEDDVESYAKVTASTMKEVAEEILGRVCPIPVEVGVGWGKSWGEIDK
jgi:DNA polymerase I